MEGKNSFVLYTDLIHTVNKLSNDKAGLLLKHILSYVNDENPSMNDDILDLVFEPIKQSLKRDLTKWQTKKQLRSEAGRLGGIAKASNMKQDIANLANASKPSKCKQELANLAVSVTVSDSVSVKQYNIHIGDKNISVSEFYYLEIENSKEKSLHEKYKLFVAYLYGHNQINEPLKCWLNLKTQLPYEKYELLHKKSKEKNKSIGEMLLSAHNKPKYTKGNSSIFLTLNSWLNRPQ